METIEKTTITVETTVSAPVEKVWKNWSEPKHITQWSHPSDDWHTPYAENDLKTGGTFKSTMAAKDGSMSFDFEGVYSNVDNHKEMAYTIADGRKVKVVFTTQDGKTKVTETFEAEGENPVEMQRAGWQAILDNFRKYTEAN
jgi:uncharacterized protein YndB with AHSA1/START domain